MAAPFNSPPEEAAAYWFARMRADRVADADRERFMRWLNEDASHAQAYAGLTRLWDDLDDAAADEAVLDMRRQALELAPARQAPSWRSAAAIAAMLAIVLVAGLLLFGAPPAPGPAGPTTLAMNQPGRILRTAVGQMSTVSLRDGSVVQLNTDSIVQVNYSEGRRDVKLVRGQALFEVAHDPARPFVVEAAGRRITALGTAFDVRVDGTKMRVTLIEGSVSVEAIAAADARRTPRTTLRPGEQLLAAADQPSVVLPVDVEKQVSWRTGRLIFSDEPLGDVVEELNRHSDRKIVLADPTLADLRVSGVFRAGAVGSFVTAIDAAFPIAAESRGDEVVLSWE